MAHGAVNRGKWLAEHYDCVCGLEVSVFRFSSVMEKQPAGCVGNLTGLQAFSTNPSCCGCPATTPSGPPILIVTEISSQLAHRCFLLDRPLAPVCRLLTMNHEHIFHGVYVGMDAGLCGGGAAHGA